MTLSKSRKKSAKV